MNIKDIRGKIASKEYDFLRTNEHLGSHIILLGLGGSHAYGTNTENSDLGVRGVVLNTKRELLTNTNFECFVNEETDTIIYSFNKLIKLLAGCNPNIIELLGLKREHYIYLTGIGEEILENRKLFLSQKAAHTFGAYASAQLRRLENKSARLVSQSENEQHILKSIEHARYEYANRFFDMPDDSIRLYIDKAVQDGYDTEIFMDVNLTHYPLRDYKSMWSEMQSIVKSYAKIGKWNEHAIEHDKLGKHMMHLIRLYMMCLDILEKEEIITYREKEHDLLMSIRNGDFLDDNRQPVPEFFEMVDEYEKRLDYAKKNTSLPPSPDYNKINDFMGSVNERIVLDQI